MVAKNAFELVSTQFSTGNIPYILIGGFAVNEHKVTRQTIDIDFMIRDGQAKQAIRLLENAGYKMVNLQDAFVQFRSDNPALMDLDLMLVDNETFDEIFNKKIKVRLFDHDFYVPCIDHLIAMKLHALKNNFSYRQDTDLPDIRKLVRINNIDPHSQEFQNLCLKYGTLELYRLIIRDMEKP